LWRNPEANLANIEERRWKERRNDVKEQKKQVRALPVLLDDKIGKKSIKIIDKKEKNAIKSYIKVLILIDHKCTGRAQYVSEKKAEK
jgi:hypothetical protein